ncbi:MAG: DNA methyltransferase, partial [Bacteriovoracaceae bacterium]
MSETNSKSSENFKFEPIKGYPRLNWKGKRPFTMSQYFPAQLKESYYDENNPEWFNKLFWGDNLQVMSHLLKDFRSKIDLIYIDPPFDSKADYKKKIKVGSKTLANDMSIFEEKQYSDIWSNDEYLQFMYERLILARELLADTGSLFIHCDYRKNYQLRCILDEVFGEENFCNEIIWKRTSAHSDSSGFGQVHDTIYFYRKTS